jgi:Spy/CpxP family protein refolding chaperone
MVVPAVETGYPYPGWRTNMRWTTSLSIAALLGATLTLVLPAADAAPAPAAPAAERVAMSATCAPPHPLGLRAGLAEEFPGGPPHGPGGMPGLEAPLPPYLHNVALSDEQQDKIFALLHAQAPQVRQLARTLRRSRTQLRDLGLADQYDETAARGLVDAASRADGELALLRARTDHAIRALLTPEQRRQLAAQAADPQSHERGGRHPGASCWH